MGKIKNSLLTGVGALLPIFLTVYVVVRLFNMVDSWLQVYIERFFGQEILGLGFLVILVLVFFLGSVTNTYIVKKLTNSIDWIFSRIPFIKSVYTTIRGIVSLSKPNENSFKDVVLVEFPNKDTKSIGFITKHNIMRNGSALTSVFIPTTPNPTNGFLVYVKKEQIEVLDMSVEDGIKAVISLGSLTPQTLELKNK